jgi:hypothetical protein
MAALLIMAYKEKVFLGRVRHPLLFTGAALLLIIFYAWVKILKKKGAARAAA